MLFADAYLFGVFLMFVSISLTSSLLLKLLVPFIPALASKFPVLCKLVQLTGQRQVLEKQKILHMIFSPISIKNWKCQIILRSCPLESKPRHEVSDCKSSGNPSVFFQNMNYLLCPPILVMITAIP